MHYNMRPVVRTERSGPPQAPEPLDGARPSAPAQRAPGFTAGAYFIGKALWGKGYTELLALLAAHKAATGVALRVDAYGAGEDAEDIRAKARHSCGFMSPYARLGDKHKA